MQIRITQSLHIRHDFRTRDRFVNQRDDRQRNQGCVSPRISSPCKVFGMSTLVQRDRRDVAVEVDGIGVGIEMITAEETTGQDGFTQDGQRPKAVPPGPGDTLIRGQAFPIVQGSILIEPNLYMIELVGRQIAAQRILCLFRDAMIVDSHVPQQ